MDGSRAELGPAWYRRGGRNAAGLAVVCRLPEPPVAAVLEPIRAVLREHNAPLPYAPDLIDEYSGGFAGAPARLAVLYPPGTPRAVPEGLADQLRTLPAVSDVAVLVPAEGDELPPIPRAS